MATIAGTKVISKIVPTDTADTYATHDDKYGAGGLKTDVADSTERINIPANRRKKGMLVYQTDTQDYYKLENDLTTWTNKGSLEGGGVTTNIFTELFDVPDNYTGHAGKAVYVNPTEDGLEFKNNCVALTDAATIATNANLAFTYTVTLGGNRILGAPTNPKNCQKILWRFKQDGTGSRTLTLDPIFRIPASIDNITLSTSPNTTDYLAAIYNGDDNKWDILAFVKGI